MRLRGEPLKDYEHKYAGSVASLGLHQGVAQVYGIKLKGWPAWFMHRTYPMSRMPTLNNKIRVFSTGLWHCSSAGRWSRSVRCSGTATTGSAPVADVAR